MNYLYVPTLTPFHAQAFLVWFWRGSERWFPLTQSRLTNATHSTYTALSSGIAITN